MASIRKRPPQTANGKERWLADYVDQSGKRHNKSFATKKAATAWLDIAKIEVANGVHTPSSADITIREAGELWLRQGEADGLEASTLRQYRQHLNLHILPFIGRTKLAELSPGHLQELRDRLLLEGRSRDMTKRVTVSLGALLATAMAYGKVARNVVRDQARQRGTRERRLEKRHDRQLEIGVDIPTKDEIRALLDAAAVVAGGRWRPLLVTAVFSGLRASELRGLRWDDVDLAAETLTVRQRADRWNMIGSPKSAAGKRSVPLVPLVVNTLKEWRLACPKGEKNLVFANGKGNVESLLNIHRRGLGPVQHAAGITTVDAICAQQLELSDAAAVAKARRHPKYGLHALRHAAASLFIEQGMNAKRVQTIMGHSSVGVTLDTYTHLWPQPEDDKAAMRQLQARLVGAAG